MGPIGAAELAARLGATSADHLDHVSDDGIRALAESGTVGVLLPGVTYHMMEMTPKVEGDRLVAASKPHWPLLVRRLVGAGVRLALSADYNPGTSPTPSMQAAMRLGACLYRLGYSEVWHMATINAAHALDRGDDRGSLESGKRADLVIWRVPEHGMVINRFGVNLVETVIKDGRVVVDGGKLSGRSARIRRSPRHRTEI
jgi:imidazolonepropionase